jgi:hypothetical protein
MNTDDIATKKDIEQLEKNLLEGFRKIFQNGDFSEKKYLRSAEVCTMLGISLSSLQNLRILGHLSYSKVSGTLFYEYEDVIKMIEDNKIK